MRLVEFIVAGEPAPQGSKTVGRSKSGRSFVREDNPATAPWRNAVAAAARRAMTYHADEGTSGYHEPLLGPVALTVRFVFRRPKSHYGTGRNAGKLKRSAPDFVTTRPDVDKLLRAIGDAVTGIVVRDDSQVVIVMAQKRYGSPCAELSFQELP